MKLTFREVSKIISKRYNLNAADANQTVKLLIDDNKTFRNEDELNNYLEDLEKGEKNEKRK